MDASLAGTVRQGGPLAQSLHFEDVSLEAVYETAAHTVTERDIALFCDITRDHHPLHTDDAFAREMGFSGRIAHGLYGLSLLEGLKAELGLYTTTSVASLGWDEVRFSAPIYPGDTLRTTVSFESKRPSRRPGRGVVVERVALLNQRGEAVITARHATLLLMREHPGEAAETG